MPLIRAEHYASLKIETLLQGFQHSCFRHLLRMEHFVLDNCAVILHLKLDVKVLYRVAVVVE